MRIVVDVVIVSLDVSTMVIPTIDLVPLINVNITRYYSGRYGLISSDYFGNRIVSVRMRIKLGVTILRKRASIETIMFVIILFP